ncbi:hypothetical protein K1719_016177 [Acacia pycnantha]|nr:hypothetical protein K1719_016177 [Acacia pycnantha]
MVGLSHTFISTNTFGTTWLKALTLAVVNRNPFSPSQHNHPLLISNAPELVPFFDSTTVKITRSLTSPTCLIRDFSFLEDEGISKANNKGKVLHKYANKDFFRKDEVGL